MPRDKRSTTSRSSTPTSPSQAAPLLDLTFDPLRVVGDFSVSPLILPPAPVAAAELELDRILFDE